MAEFTLYGLPMWSVSGPAAPPAPALTLAGAQSLSAGEATTAAVEQTNTRSRRSAPRLAIVPDPGDRARGGDLRRHSGPYGESDSSARHLLVGTGRRAGDASAPDPAEALHPAHRNDGPRRADHGAHVGRRSLRRSGLRPAARRPGRRTRASSRSATSPSRPSCRPCARSSRRRASSNASCSSRGSSSPIRARPTPNPQLGVQRLFSHVGRTGLPLDERRLHLAGVPADRGHRSVGGNAAFAVDVTDLTPSGAGQVKQVVVGVRSGPATVWKFANLAQSPSNPARWSGGVPIAETQFEYFVQAVDAAGNVAVSTNKGFYYNGEVAPPEPLPGHVVGRSRRAGDERLVHERSRRSLVDAPDGVTVEASIDGGAFGRAAEPRSRVTACTRSTCAARTATRRGSSRRSTRRRRRSSSARRRTAGCTS